MLVAKRSLGTAYTCCAPRFPENVILESHRREIAPWSRNVVFGDVDSRYSQAVGIFGPSPVLSGQRDFETRVGNGLARLLRPVPVGVGKHGALLKQTFFDGDLGVFEVSAQL